jgi:plasmid replication initiation protein
MIQPSSQRALVVTITLVLLASLAHGKLSNAVTDWLAATQARVAATGVHNVPASRWYAQTALAIHNALAKGGAPPQALAGWRQAARQR